MPTIPDVGDWLKRAPWRDRSVSLIFISDWLMPEQEHTLAGKRDLLELVRGIERGTLLVAWHGEWKTDVRIIGPESRGWVERALA